jgi:hypothetical protein
MTRLAPVPASPAFEAIAGRAQFRDRVMVAIKASPEAIFAALRQVTLRDMKLAWLLGELRYLPSRLAGRQPASDSRLPFLTSLIEGGTLVLRDDTPRELITGSAAQLHRVHQAPQRFASRAAFEAFDDPDHEKLFISVRVARTGRPGAHWLILEHATRAMSPLAERKFSRYWRLIKPMGAFVTWQLLRAVRRRAERARPSRSRIDRTACRGRKRRRPRAERGAPSIPRASRADAERQIGFFLDGAKNRPPSEPLDSGARRNDERVGYPCTRLRRVTRLPARDVETICAAAREASSSTTNSQPQARR